MESILNKERLSLMAPKLLLRQHWDNVVFADKQSKRAVAKVKLKSNTTHCVLGKKYCTLLSWSADMERSRKQDRFGPYTDTVLTTDGRFS